MSRIEECMEGIVEAPFRRRSDFDFPLLEIGIKRVMEKKRRRIFGRVVVPASYEVIVNDGLYEEFAPFFDKFHDELAASLTSFAKEKGYETVRAIDIQFKKGFLQGDAFNISVVAERGIEGREGCRKDPVQREDFSKIRVGETLQEKEALLGEVRDLDTGLVYPIPEEGALLGRGEGCGIRFTDETVSERHAKFSAAKGRLILEDLESKNGTWVNHRRIDRVRSKSGDRITMGNTALILRLYEDEK